MSHAPNANRAPKKKERPEEKEEEVYKVKVKSEKIEEAKNRRRLNRIFFKKILKKILEKNLKLSF